MSTSTPSPVTLEPICVERIWGADTLTPWYTGPKPDAPIGEIWLTAETCRAEGENQTLADLTAAAPASFGDPHGQGFPLLIKLLFPREKLSVQVHPDDAQAQALGMPRGKTECWYILSADPGAQVAVGFQNPLTPAEVKASIEDGSLESHLRMIPVHPGDMIFVDAGTVHAIGPGMIVLETQQYSDTTYRLWDYGRPRELHVEAGARVTRTQTAAGLVNPQPMDGFTRLVTCPYFSVDHFQLSANTSAPLNSSSQLQILIALDEHCTLQTGTAQPISLPRAKAVILPADAAPSTLAGPASARIIRVLQP